jgi:phage-related protein
VGALLPALTPLFDVLTTTFTQLAPIVAQVGTTLAAVLAPIIASLPAILQPLIDNISQVSAAILPLVSQVLTALTPALVQLGGAVAELAVALAPVLVLVSGLAARLLVKLMPIITPLITLVGKLASVLASILAGAITNVVVPAINIITSLFTGRFTAAGKAVTALVTGIGRQFATTFRGVREAVSAAITTAIGLLQKLPGQAKSALSGLGSLLYKSGRALVQGFINGIKSLAGAVGDAASSVVSKARDFFPFSPAKKGPFSGKGWTLHSGQAISQALADGITARGNEVQRAVSGVLSSASLPLNAPSIRNAGATALASPRVTVNAAAAPRVTVMIGNRVVDEHVRVIVDRANEDAARQQLQGVRR